MNYEVRLHIQRDDQAAEYLQQKFAGHAVPLECSFFISDLSELPAKRDIVTYELVIEDGADAHVVWVEGIVLGHHRTYMSRNMKEVIENCVISCKISASKVISNDEVIWPRSSQPSRNFFN